MKVAVHLLSLAAVAFPLFLSAAEDQPTVEEVKTIAEEGYHYGLPLVMAYTASYECLYWPQSESPSILPPGEGDWSPPAIQKVK